MRDAFHEQLDSVFDDLAGICRQVEDAVRRATEALLDRRRRDRRAGDQRRRRDRPRPASGSRSTAFSLLSLQQPVAGDLRTIVAALRMVSELERMGDLSVHVAKIARLRVPNVAVPDEVQPTVDADGRGRRGHGGAGSARSSPTATSRPRSSSAATTRRWTSCAAPASPSCSPTTGAHGVEAAVDIALLGRYYERIADHAVSVANRVVFVVTGQNPAPSA